MKFIFFILFGCMPGMATAQTKQQTAILQVLNKQLTAWNAGNTDAFMEGYWKNDSLLFIGKSGLTQGWQQTLDNYKKGYPDTASMGKLQFTILKINKINKSNYFVVGKWFLKRSIGDIGGHFSLLFKRIRKKWVIVADHSS
jgi:hypothetical protein